MKKSMTYKIGTLVIGLTAMLFTSCLSDGDDTMVLERERKTSSSMATKPWLSVPMSMPTSRMEASHSTYPRVPCQRPTLATTDEWLFLLAMLTFPTCPASCQQVPA